MGRKKTEPVRRLAETSDVPLIEDIQDNKNEVEEKEVVEIIDEDYEMEEEVRIVEKPKKISWYVNTQSLVGIIMNEVETEVQVQDIDDIGLLLFFLKKQELISLIAFLLNKQKINQTIRPFKRET